MARVRIIYQGGEPIAEYRDNQLVWSHKPVDETGRAPYVMDDIQPYRSMIDGSMISSRSTHRAHLRANGCIEIGNETKYLQPKPIAPPPGLKETLISVAAEKLRYK